MASPNIWNQIHPTVPHVAVVELEHKQVLTTPFSKSTTVDQSHEKYPSSKRFSLRNGGRK